ncbi:MAG: hypothetical protein V4516_02535, partial [Pseudomonadota bacterium]
KRGMGGALGEVAVSHIIEAHEVERRRLTEALNQARAKVSELAATLGEALAEIDRLRGKIADPERK